MSQYDDTNSGVLFREREKKSDKAPDFKGKLNVEGKEYEIAGWTRTSKAGNNFLSLKVSEPWKGREQQKSEEAPRADFDDGIPFN